MDKKLIFISCGQRTRDEKELGELAKSIVDATPGFQGYFAEHVHSLDGLSSSILSALQRCSGFICFLQYRGNVTTLEGEDLGRRSSVWVNQEIAILAYRRFFEATQIPALVFTEEDLTLEGAMTSLIVNPLAITSTTNVASRVTEWLAKSEFPWRGSEKRFWAKWERMTDTDKMVLRAIIDEGSEHVLESTVRRYLMDEKDMGINNASETVSTAALNLGNYDFITHEMTQTGNELSIKAQWKWDIMRALNT